MERCPWKLHEIKVVTNTLFLVATWTPIATSLFLQGIFYSVGTIISVKEHLLVYKVIWSLKIYMDAEFKNKEKICIKYTIITINKPSVTITEKATALLLEVVITLNHEVATICTRLHY